MVGKKKASPSKRSPKQAETAKDSEPTRVPLHTQLGITFPVTRIQRYMKERGVAERVSVKAAIAVATTLEFLCSEVIEVVGDGILKDEGAPMRIKPRHITLAIRSDEDLADVLGSETHIATGGVIPWIEPEVAVKSKRKRRAKATGEEEEEEESGEEAED